MTQISMPTRALWRAWREKSDVPGMTVLRVVGLCPSVPGVSGRVLLQESISADLGNHWGGEGAKSGLLVLERLMVPPALGDTEASAVNPQQIRLPAYPWCYPWEVNEENNKAQPLLITFRKDEKNTRPSQSQMPSPLSAPSYTHVTILPDEITVPIQ